MDNIDLTLTLKLAEVQVVLAGLGKLPMENSLEVWSKIKNQAETQLKDIRQPENDEIQAEAPPAAA